MASRDLPKSVGQFAWGWTHHLRDEITWNKSKQELIDNDLQPDEVEKQHKVKMKNLWPAFCAGAGLFSDGYVNNSIGTVSYALKTIYGKTYTNSNAISNISSIAFVGTVVGQLSFGYISDRIARKGGMMAANIILILFTILCAAATWGAHGSPQGLFAALTTFRFFLGIGIGAEYPTASVIASEFANQLPAGKRNRYFNWFTNTMIDFGFVVSAFVPLVLLWIFSKRHLTAVWRMTLGLGAIPPISLFFMRLKMADSDSFQKLNMKKVKKYPYWLIFKFYWFRLTIISLIWFIYDFSAYAFGIYSSFIIGSIIPDGDIYKTWGWNVVFNLFYMPGALLGALAADYIGPRLTLFIGVGLQGVIGFIMAGLYPHLKHHVGAFVVVYGIFTTLGEFGPGDNIGLLASKTSATPIRGQYYGIAAAIGKIGAFVGTWVFPVIIKNAGGSDTDSGNQAPFYVSSALCIFSAVLALLFLPGVGQDAINKEDADFVQFLKDNGYDTAQLGNGEVVETTSVDFSDDLKNKKSPDNTNVEERSLASYN
ncbi:glycerophosphoinositol permease [Scheffersomyces xylosifermentans]|uniref:glycerophosphoinositol permease n=1 Tax=Scheffersomyces xylosifermentans TaxID=1304137 RepID=UPI00315CC560